MLGLNLTHVNKRGLTLSWPALFDLVSNLLFNLSSVFSSQTTLKNRNVTGVHGGSRIKPILSSSYSTIGATESQARVPPMTNYPSIYLYEKILAMFPYLNKSPSCIVSNPTPDLPSLDDWQETAQYHKRSNVCYSSRNICPPHEDLLSKC